MFISDTHADTLYALGVQGNKAPTVSKESLTLGGVTLQVMALFTGSDGNKGDVDGIVKKELAAFDMLLGQGFVQVFSPSEQKEGQLSLMLSIEGCEMFEKELHAVEAYYEKGVRMAALVWNNENRLGFPAKGKSPKGLTEYGLQVVKEMQRLKMAVDTSHLNEQGFYDLFLKTHTPPMASHSCCAALCPHFRNLTDAQIKLMIQNGGYIGINFYPRFLKDAQATLTDVVNHIDHVCQLGGQDIVGFGSDFDGIEIMPQNLESPADFPRLIAALKARGYDEKTIENIAGKNLIAYFQRIS